jgi:hypothetical protein
MVFVLTLIFAVTITSLFFLPQNSVSKLAKTDERLLLQSSNATPVKRQVAQANPADVLILKRYAENYEPKSTKLQVIPSPPVPNEKVLQAISNLANTQSREHEKYIMLIFLRLSRFQIEHFKQRYELGRDELLTKEFFRLIGEADYQKAEIMPAYLVDNYVEKNTELLKYSLIEKEMARIEKGGEKIKKELAQIIKG